MLRIALATLLFLALNPESHALENGLARTPPMGWNSWNSLGCDVTARDIRDAADALVSSGMRELGYRYVNVDDCWQSGARIQGRLAADPSRFPGGMKALSDYVHSKGLKFGIYSDAGTKTCGGRPGSHGYEDVDARTFADWGVDYLKYDFCFTDGLGAGQLLYEKMRDALAKTGRPIIFSLCSWGTAGVSSWGPETGNLWRTTPDITDDWWGFTGNLESNGLSDAHAGPGAWNDPDILTVGLYGEGAIEGSGMTEDEYTAEFSLWALMAAPLLAGNDLRRMDSGTRRILTNAEVIAVDQDPLGAPGRKISDDGNVEVWSKPLAGPGARAVVLFNRGDLTEVARVQWNELSLGGRRARVRDLWEHQDLGVLPDGYAAFVAAHSAVMLRVQEVTP